MGCDERAGSKRGTGEENRKGVQGDEEQSKSRRGVRCVLNGEGGTAGMSNEFLFV